MYKMQHQMRYGERICIGFAEEYRKFCSGKESKIFRIVPGYGRKPDLYSMCNTTGGIFSCDANGVLPHTPKLEGTKGWGKKEIEWVMEQYCAGWYKHFRS